MHLGKQFKIGKRDGIEISSLLNKEVLTLNFPKAILLILKRGSGRCCTNTTATSSSLYRYNNKKKSLINLKN
jgi:hypothetical protein